jgi:hypothetical protein
LSADWDEKVLHDMVALAKKNVTIRQNSIRNTGVAGASEDNPYAPPAAPAAPAQGGGDWFGSNAPAAANFSSANEKDAQGNAVVSGVSKAWDWANTPFLPQIAAAAHEIANYMSRPQLAESEANDTVPGLGTASAMIRGGAAGAVEGAGNVLSSFTSPIGIALTLAGLKGEGVIAENIPAMKSLLDLPAVQALQRAVQGASGAGFAAHGAHKAVTAPTLAEKAQGVVEMAAGGLGVAGAAGGGAARQRPAAVAPTADEAAVAWGQQQGIPVDAGTATGNTAIKGIQYMSDRTLAGSMVAKGAAKETTAALGSKGEQLADQARGAAVAPEQAGQGIRDALNSKMQAHTDLADASYEKLRQFEADPRNRIAIATKPEAVDALPSHVKGQLRRIVHELDAKGYEAGKLVVDDLDHGDTHYVHRSGGAAVFDDITAGLGYNPTRAAIQEELEAYLGGGKETAIVKAALGVAKERAAQRPGSRSTISTPELPPSEMNTPTRLEAKRVTSEDMGLPVDTRAAKAALRPVYEQMRRQMPVTQQEANPGLKALGNILDGPDMAPLSQVDRDLSAIKAIARKQGGLAKMGAGKLDQAVQQAAANGGPEVLRALYQGRQATIAKVGTEELIGALPGGKLEEPVAVFKRATQPQDGGIEFLRAVKEHTPQAIPQIARAKLDELLSMKPDKMHAEWLKQGAETRKILFPQPGQSMALDHFFLLQKRLQENMNPSGSGVAAMHVAEGATLYANPVAFVASQVGSAGLSSILHSRRGVNALTRLLSTSVKATAAKSASPALLRSAAQTAGWAEVVAAARAVGVPLQVPATADSTTTGATER